MQTRSDFERMSPEAVTSDPLPQGEWQWRNLRGVGFGLQLWSWPWPISSNFDADAYGGHATASFGPIELTFHFNCGGLGGVRRVAAVLSEGGKR